MNARKREVWELLVKKHVVDLIYFLILCGCCILFLRGISDFYPLDLWDESNYIWLGTRYHGLALLEWGPLYALFYRLIYQFQHDPILLFYLNLGIQVAAITLLHFLLSRRMGVSGLYSFIGAFFVLISTANAPILDKINHFNLICSYTVLLLASFLKNELLAVTWLSLGFLSLIYLRQDNLVISFFFLALLCSKLLFDTESWPRKGAKIATVVFSYGVLVALLFSAIGTPFAHSRSWSAFKDYFYWNNAYLHPEEHDVPRDLLIRNVFHSSDSIFQAALSNPLEFLKYVYGNISRFLGTFPRQLAEHFPFIRSDAAHFLHESHLESLWLFIAAGLVSLRYLTLNGFSKFHRTKNSPVFRIFYFFVFFCLIKSIIDVAIFTSVPRYYFEFLFSFILLFFALLDRFSGEKNSVAFIAIPLIILFFCPNHRDPHLYLAVQDFSNRAADPVKKASLFLRGVHLAKEKQWFCVGTYSTYISDSTSCLNPWEFFESRNSYLDLADFLTRKNCALVVMDRGLISTLKRVGQENDILSLKKFLQNAQLRKVFEGPEGVEIWAQLNSGAG